MIIESDLIDEFISKTKYRPYKKIRVSLLTGGKPYSLNVQPEFDQSDFLPDNIRSCVKAYTHDKDSAIALFRDFVGYLGDQGIPVDVSFPPIPVSNSFERLMFIAKYLQEPIHSIADLPNVLWVSERTIEEDLRRLRGIDDPIQVCGRVFAIPDTERHDGQLTFVSTAHPLFLTENLTQILVLLKGLKHMAENPLYSAYARLTGAEIWDQLSPYAKKRIHFVLGELMPEDLKWYESLGSSEHSFHTEEMCSRVMNTGSSVLLDCIKNGKSFCLEQDEHVYQNCQVIEGSYKFDNGCPQVDVECSAGRITVYIRRVIRSAYTIEELCAD